LFCAKDYAAIETTSNIIGIFWVSD